MTPSEIKSRRKAAGLTQSEAAALVHCHVNVWQKYEYGTLNMIPCRWELFCLKTAGLIPTNGSCNDSPRMDNQRTITGDCE